MARLSGGTGPARGGWWSRESEARGKEDREPERLRTRLSLPAATVATASYRLVVLLGDGRERLVSLGRTRGELTRLARGVANRVARGAVGLRVQRWTGSPLRGSWETVEDLDREGR